MIELIDIDGNIKFMANIITGIKYGDGLYLLYSIDRNKDEKNLFVSKLVENSMGYAMDNNFTGGEKEALDDVIATILSKKSIDELNDMGISFLSNMELTDINRFSVSNCYVASYSKNLLSECIDYYKFSGYNNIREKVTVKEKEVSYLSKNNRPTVYLILLGIFVIIISIVVIVGFFK